MTPAGDLLRRARAAGIMVACAESCTGGLLAGAITEVAGASAIFDRGFVTYTNAAKQQMLGVSANTLRNHGAVSEAVAAEMADGALARSDAHMAVAVTGIAGPGGAEHKPEGRVCFALAAEGRETTAITMEFGAIGRASVRQSTVDFALDLLIRALPEAPK